MSGRKHRRKIAQAADALKLGGAELAEVARGDVRMVLQQDGKDVVSLISAADLERLESLDRRTAEGFRAIEAIWSRNAHLDPEEVERDIAEAIAEVRAEARAQKSAASHT